MKKHVFALGMAAAMCFNLVGCSNGNNTESTAAANAECILLPIQVLCSILSHHSFPIISRNYQPLQLEAHSLILSR